MKAEQISVFLENRSGSLSRVVHILSNEKIKILAMSLADTSDFGILRLIVADLEKTRQCLSKNGFTIGSASVVAVKIAEDPAIIDDLLQVLAARDINVEYMYAFLRDRDASAMIFRFDKMDEAIDLLGESGYALLSSKELATF